MPDLLPPRNLISTRGHHQRRSSVRRASSDPLPSPAASKEFFVAIRSMAYGDKLTTNLSRAVVQIIRQSESAGWENEADDFVEVVDAWQVEPSEHERRHELQFNKSRMPDELTTRLASILRDAEYEGRLPDVIKSFDELVAAGIASKDKTTLGSFFDHARRLARIGQTDAALDIIFD